MMTPTIIPIIVMNINIKSPLFQMNIPYAIIEELQQSSIVFFYFFMLDFSSYEWFIQFKLIDFSKLIYLSIRQISTFFRK